MMNRQSAAEDSLWRKMQSHEDVPFRVYDLEEHVFNAWARTANLENRSSDRITGFMHRDRLVKLRDQVLSRPLISVDALVLCGHAVAQEELEYRQLNMKRLNSRKKKSRPDQKGHSKEITTQSKAARWAKSGAGAEKIKEVRKELVAALKRLEGVPDGGDIMSSPSRNPRIERPNSTLLSSSLLAHVRVGSSCSTKLNYILNEVRLDILSPSQLTHFSQVLQYAADEKFLIFSDSPLSLSHVAEGLNLINVKFLQFTTQVVPQVREQLVTTFETSDTFRVFLMELKHGARGLSVL
jgi:SNF2 family DNA or RNA helicase